MNDIREYCTAAAEDSDIAAGVPGDPLDSGNYCQSEKNIRKLKIPGSFNDEGILSDRLGLEQMELDVPAEE